MWESEESKSKDEREYDVDPFKSSKEYRSGREMYAPKRMYYNDNSNDVKNTPEGNNIEATVEEEDQEAAWYTGFAKVKRRVKGGN